MTDEPRWTELAMQAGRVFSPSAPIDELSLFAGRDSQIRTVVDAINQKGQHVIIYGERGVGKTSLSNVLHGFLGQQKFPIVAPRVQCEALDTFDKVWRRVFDKIELSREKKGIIRLGNPTEREPYRASELLNGGEVAPDDVRRVLGIVAKSALPIVIVDEFDRLRRRFRPTLERASPPVCRHGQDPVGSRRARHHDPGGRRRQRRRTDPRASVDRTRAGAGVDAPDVER